jgi:bifunctional N-acetylglucosamine-1-phosphate-uridyltransferase/glucosamine-1-phosphate-acetyltransferase GlmU-like protein
MTKKHYVKDIYNVCIQEGFKIDSVESHSSYILNALNSKIEHSKSETFLASKNNEEYTVIVSSFKNDSLTLKASGITKQVMQENYTEIFTTAFIFGKTLISIETSRLNKETALKLMDEIVIYFRENNQ